MYHVIAGAIGVSQLRIFAATKEISILITVVYVLALYAHCHVSFDKTGRCYSGVSRCKDSM